MRGVVKFWVTLENDCCSFNPLHHLPRYDSSFPALAFAAASASTMGLLLLGCLKGIGIVFNNIRVARLVDFNYGGVARSFVFNDTWVAVALKCFSNGDTEFVAKAKSEESANGECDGVLYEGCHGCFVRAELVSMRDGGGCCLMDGGWWI